MTDNLSQALALIALAAGMLGAAYGLGIIAYWPGATMALASTIAAGLGVARMLGIGR